jgi:ethanolamine ammonia-lyase large subunit
VKLSTLLFNKSYKFKSIKDVLACANEARSGDELAGIAARSEEERIASKDQMSANERAVASFSMIRESDC